jgi:hypothetical protein
MVANRRRCGFSSGPLASITTTINTFLCTSIPAIFIASSWRGSGRTHAKRLHTVTCYHPPTQMGGATQIGSKRAFRIKLRNGLTSSRVYTDLRRPRSISVQAQTRPDFHVNGWAAGPYEVPSLQQPLNSVLWALQIRRLEGSRPGGAPMQFGRGRWLLTVERMPCSRFLLALSRREIRCAVARRGG